MVDYNVKEPGPALKQHWESQHLILAPGASGEQLAKFETRYHVVLPSDMRAYFLYVNGMLEDWRNGQCENGFSFWPLHRVRPVKDEAAAMRNGILFAASLDGYFLFCDYLTWCWAYAIRMSSDTSEPNPVVFVGVERERLKAADSFSEFVELYLADSPRLYNVTTVDVGGSVKPTGGARS